MQKLAYAFVTAFAVSVLSLGFSAPASAEGGCSYGHKVTAQSKAQEVAQTKPLQTPKPSGS